MKNRVHGNTPAWVRLALVAALCALFCAPTQAQTDNTPTSDLLKVVVLGDSLTSGFQLAEKDSFTAQLEYYARSQRYNVKIINMSRISQTSAQGLYRLDEILAAKPDMVLIQLGYNDALQGISMRELSKNLNTLIHNISYHDIYMVLVRTAPPPSMGLNDKRDYEYIYLQLVAVYNAVPYFSLLDGVLGNPGMTLDDNTHPNARGTQLIVSRLFPIMQPLLHYRLQMRRYKASQKR